MNCKSCAISTTNPVFCSTSCSASYNNTHRPKRPKQISICLKCGKQISWRSKHCIGCQPHLFENSLQTIGELRKELGTYEMRGSIREHSRRIYWKQGQNKKECKNCGYSKHVMVCHITDLGSMPDETTIVEANRLDNLIGLCPNCHWELDNGLLHL